MLRQELPEIPTVESWDIAIGKNVTFPIFPGFSVGDLGHCCGARQVYFGSLFETKNTLGFDYYQEDKSHFYGYKLARLDATAEVTKYFETWLERFHTPSKGVYGVYEAQVFKSMIPGMIYIAVLNQNQLDSPYGVLLREKYGWTVISGPHLNRNSQRNIYILQFIGR